MFNRFFNIVLIFLIMIIVSCSAGGLRPGTGGKSSAKKIDYEFPLCNLLFKVCFTLSTCILSGSKYSAKDSTIPP